MTINPPTITELQERIAESAGPNGMDEPTALAWHGYLGALLEGGLITRQERDQLVELLPALAAAPAVVSSLGAPEH